MKATGIVRRIDDLGRVVIPKEIRRTLKIREGEPMEIFTEIGGSVGGILGMQLFRHKTKHKTFTVGFPAILVCQLALAAYILLKWKWNLL